MNFPMSPRQNQRRGNGPDHFSICERLELGSKYAVTLSGHCMGQCIPSGIVAWVDAEAEIMPGHLCSIELSKEAGPWRSFLEQLWVGEDNPADDFPTGFAKIFIRRQDTPDGELFWLGHLNPPAVGVFHRSEIESPSCADGLG